MIRDEKMELLLAKFGQTAGDANRVPFHRPGSFLCNTDGIFTDVYFIVFKLHTIQYATVTRVDWGDKLC